MDYTVRVFIPTRGVDDLTYHLPAIYEYIQNQEIFLLPLYYRMHFVLPMNAEFLFMWPLNYFKSTNSIGLIQYTYSLIGMIVIYALARSLSLKRNISYFSSQLFFFDTSSIIAIRISIYRNNHECFCVS